MSQPSAPHLRIEPLEPRETPTASAWTLESFDRLSAPNLPQSWSQWSNLGLASFATSSTRTFSGSNALTTNGPSNLTARVWQNAPLPADFGVSATVYTDSLIPMQVFARGANLAGNTPTYYAASITRGLDVQLVRVVNGASTTLADLKTQSYLSGQWVKVSLLPDGNQLGVEVLRTDTGQYLNSAGAWQSARTAAIRVSDGAIQGDGQVGLNRPASAAGAVTVDDFTVLTGTSANTAETFDSLPPGTLPADWSQWTNDGSTGFAPSTVRALSPTQSLSANGISTSTSRAWVSDPMPADAQVSASVYADSLIPAQVFVRGSDLDTLTPTYYAASITRGVSLQLLKVIDGTPTVIGSLKSNSYVSGVWLRVTLAAEGGQLRASVFRTDTNQWLNAQGNWQDDNAVALTATDASIGGAAGQVGIVRQAIYAGPVYFDDFQVVAASSDTQAPTVGFTSPSAGATLSGVVNVAATAADANGVSRVEFYVDGVLQATANNAPYTWSFDTRTVANGTHALSVRAYDPSGNMGVASESIGVNNTVTPTPTPSAGSSLPTIPAHYSHIRIAQLAYSGTPMGSFEQQLLQNSVDLVVPNPTFLSTINNVSPNTPQLIYTNVSNLYQNLLTDWLNYADRNGLSRELAFYHVTQATAFSGNSPSSQPVNWFWSVQRGAANPTTGSPAPVNLTSQARSAATGDTAFGAAGDALYVAYPEKFREINFTLSRGAGAGWVGVLEYASSVDANGNPTGWTTLTTLGDGTNGFRQSGQITFDPPADWKTASVGGSDRMFYVRIRTVSGTASAAPVATTILGRDYVNANGGTTGTIPAFDSNADKNGDGYLSDAEYANRKPGSDARFVYESRLFYPYYGQMRFVTNPSSAGVKGWAADYNQRLLTANPLADGVFVDNSGGKLPISGIAVQESTANYSADYGAMLAAVNAKIAPKWVMANTAGGGAASDQVVTQVPATFSEFAMRPLASTWSQFNDLATTVAHQQSLSTPTPYLVLDSLPTGGSPTDARTQMATLAEYYLLGNPSTTFLMFYGGYSPSTSWTQHWAPAAAYNVGQPQGSWSVFATGTDPTNAALTYKVLQRSYANALVLYKPLSYALGKGTGTTADNTATTHDLGGNYRVLNADGTLGPVVTSITLRNGEGAVLIKA